MPSKAGNDTSASASCLLLLELLIFQRKAKYSNFYVKIPYFKVWQHFLSNINRADRWAGFVWQPLVHNLWNNYFWKWAKILPKVNSQGHNTTVHICWAQNRLWKESTRCQGHFLERGELWHQSRALGQLPMFERRDSVGRNSHSCCALCQHPNLGCVCVSAPLEEALEWFHC